MAGGCDNDREASVYDNEDESSEAYSDEYEGIRYVDF